MTYWIAKDFPEADKFKAAFKQMQNSPMAAMARTMVKAPLDLPGVPVKTQVDDPSGGAKITTTIVSVKEQPLDASDFTVPSDYTALPTPSFDGFGGGMRPPRLPKPQAEDNSQ